MSKSKPIQQLCKCIPRAFYPFVLIAQSKVARPKTFVVSDHAVDLSVQEIWHLNLFIQLGTVDSNT